ncbi:hypothetical protein L596_025017 [Steinernema carpocapsae]|uniref:Transmembrane protein 144 n=1 Tax=Steinernema carpocapsae TaxID=34508 RepID=A0A4U5M6J6_STECR|nr:hypothetical protein L596_025017 [Steinernema carpocapsae]
MERSSGHNRCLFGVSVKSVFSNVGCLERSYYLGAMTGTIEGLAACAVSSIFFGSMFVPIKRFDAGDGIFAQWVMCSAILVVGLAVNAGAGFPPFHPLAMLGGMFWTIGNVTAIPIMNMIGLGMGILIWGTTNCLLGWASGRFGLFGINASVPQSPMLNYFGLLLVIVGGGMFSQIRPTPKHGREEEDAVENAENAAGGSEQNCEEGDSDNSSTPVISGAMRNEGDARSPAELTSLLRTSEGGLNRSQKRIVGIVMALCAGVFYGVTFVPVIYMQDHSEDFDHASKESIPYVLSHYSGIFVTSTVILLGYLAYTRNRPFVNSRTILPSFTAGIMWAMAQLSWFLANDRLSQSITFPINSMVPGVCAALWSVFYFKEIEGRRNLRLLTIAVLVTLTGATLVGISKDL